MQLAREFVLLDSFFLSHAPQFVFKTFIDCIDFIVIDVVGEQYGHRYAKVFRARGFKFISRLLNPFFNLAEI